MVFFVDSPLDKTGTIEYYTYEQMYICIKVIYENKDLNKEEIGMKKELNKEIELCEEMQVHQSKVQKIADKLPKEEDLWDLAELFKAFGDTTRIRILYVLDLEETCVCDIAELLNLSQSAISHQLKILKSLRLVKSRRDGKTVYYSLADSHVKTIIEQGLEHIME